MQKLLTPVFALLSLLVLLSGHTAAADPRVRPTVSDIEIRFDGRDRTQVIIYASDNLDYAESAMYADGMRYWLDFDRLVWALPGGTDSKGVGQGGGHIQYYRYAHHQPDSPPGSPIVSRLVFILDQPVYVDTSFSLPPDATDPRWKIVLIFRKTDEGTFKKLKPLGVSSKSGKIRLGPDHGTDAADVIRTRQSEKATGPAKPTIVIDPGHGGVDPGAIVDETTFEKDIVLKASLKLKSLLEASGKYQVILTRTTDIRVEHEDRIRIAQNANADLFISIHADSAGNRSVKGASVYTLSEKGDARRDSFLRQGNWDMPVEIHSDSHDGQQDTEVEDILLSLMTRETLGHSADFAKLLIPELAKVGPVLRNTHRQANFYVLLSPSVPAVLLEIGFLSNADDVRRLKDEASLNRSMQAVKNAIDLYFKTHKPASAI